MLTQRMHRFAHAEPGAVKANPDGALLDVENLSDLSGVEILHIVEDKDDAISRRDAENRLLDERFLLAAEQGAFRIFGRSFEEKSKFSIVGQ